MILSLVTYYGIPYVAAPLGDLRWRPPVPIEKSGTIRYSATIQNATIGGPRCIQGQPGWALDLPAGILAAGDSADQSEDCLTLDVHAPLSPRAKRLPVVVNIHGGGYTLGSAKDTDLAPFVSFANGNIIAVNVQYRLGVYGFLSSKEVRADGTANAGLLDQRAALEWVQRNIAAFGGDPDKVTIMGGSAGGGSVQLQMMLHGGEKRPPFHAAISGTLACSFAFPVLRCLIETKQNIRVNCRIREKTSCKRSIRTSYKLPNAMTLNASDRFQLRCWQMPRGKRTS